jgi:hypothetical protein
MVNFEHAQVSWTRSCSGRNSVSKICWYWFCEININSLCNWNTFQNWYIIGRVSLNAYTASAFTRGHPLNVFVSTCATLMQGECDFVIFHCCVAVLQIRIRDPVPFWRDPEKTYPGSLTHILESFVTNFWVKSTIILFKISQNFFFNINNMK